MASRVGLTGSQKPPSMACVQARYPRRLSHDLPRLRPCPTGASDRSPPGPLDPAPSPTTRQAAPLLGRPLPQGARDHDRQALAQSGRAARGARGAHPRDALLARSALRGGTLPFEAHLREEASRPARDLAREDWLPGAPPGGENRAVGEIGASGGPRL